MGTTFQKRQKEMKRLDKQRMKAERRAQKKRENAISDAPPSESLNQNPAEQAPSPVVNTGDSHD